MTSSFNNGHHTVSAEQAKTKSPAFYIWILIGFLWSWALVPFDMAYAFIENHFPDLITIYKDIKMWVSAFIGNNQDTISEIQNVFYGIWQKIEPSVCLFVYNMTHDITFWFALPVIYIQTCFRLYVAACTIPWVIFKHIFRKPTQLGKMYFMPGRSIMITDACNEIGRKLAVQLWKQGWSLVLAGADKFSLLRLDDKLNEMCLRGAASTRQRKYMYPCDPVNYQIDFNELFSRELKDKNHSLKPIPITILINNISYQPEPVPFYKMDGEDLDRAILTNVMFPTQITQHLLGASAVPSDDETREMAGHSALKYQMATDHKTCIVNLSSFKGEVSVENEAVYAGTMAYINNWSASLRKELSPSDEFPFGVSVVCSSFVDSSKINVGHENILEASTSAMAKGIISSIGLDGSWLAPNIDYPILLQNIAVSFIKSLPNPLGNIAATALVNYLGLKHSEEKPNVRTSSSKKSRIPKPTKVKAEDPFSEVSSGNNSTASLTLSVPDEPKQRSTVKSPAGHSSRVHKQKRSAEKRSTGTPSHLRRGSASRTGSPLSQPPMTVSSSGSSRKSDSKYYPGGDPNTPGFDISSRRPTCPKTPYGTPKSPYSEIESGGDHLLAAGSPASSSGKLKYTMGRNAILADHMSSSPSNDSDMSPILLPVRKTSATPAPKSSGSPAGSSVEKKSKRSQFYKAGVNPKLFAENIKLSKKIQLEDDGNDADTEDEFSFSLTPQHMVGKKMSPPRSPESPHPKSPAKKAVLTEEPVPVNADVPMPATVVSPMKRLKAAAFVAGQRRVRSGSPKKSKSRHA